MAELAQMQVSVAVVLINGRPLAVGCLQGNPGIGAIVEGWHLGTECGNALAEILYGFYNPSGKLTVTFAHEAGQEPMYYNHPNTGKPGSDFKFTSKYLDVPVRPLYPFGYGLSYTTFLYRDPLIEKEEITPEETLRCSVKVKNAGARAGEETVQLYIRDIVASCARPIKELKRFEKILLQPGEEKEVRFELPAREMGFYDSACSYVIEPGRFGLYVGTNSEETLESSFYVK